MASMVDFAADDAWLAAEHSGVETLYTKKGEAQPNTLTLVITPRESRFAESSAGLVEVFRVHVSGESESFDPECGDRLSYGGREWDYAGLSREATGGMAHAFFESMNWQFAGATGVSPI